jgi:hypothetical protein
MGGGRRVNAPLAVEVCDGLARIEILLASLLAKQEECDNSHWWPCSWWQDGAEHHQLQSRNQKEIVLNDLCPSEVERDPISYDAAFVACGKGTEWQPTEGMDSTMVKAKVEKDPICYDAGTSVGEKGGVSDLCPSEVERDPISYDAAFVACGKGAEWQTTEGMDSTMAQAKVEINPICYDAGTSACGKGGEWQLTGSLNSTKAQTKVEKDPVSYDAVISAYGKGGEWQLTENLASAKAQAEDSASYHTISDCEGDQVSTMVHTKVERDVSYKGYISACETLYLFSYRWVSAQYKRLAWNAWQEKIKSRMLAQVMTGQDNMIENMEALEQELADKIIESNELRRSLAAATATEQPKEKWGVDKRGRVRNLAAAVKEKGRSGHAGRGLGRGEGFDSPNAAISACETGREWQPASSSHGALVYGLLTGEEAASRAKEHVSLPWEDDLFS